MTILSRGEIIPRYSTYKSNHFCNLTLDERYLLIEIEETVCGKVISTRRIPLHDVVDLKVFNEEVSKYNNTTVKGFTDFLFYLLYFNPWFWFRSGGSVFYFSKTKMLELAFNHQGQSTKLVIDVVDSSHKKLLMTYKKYKISLGL